MPAAVAHVVQQVELVYATAALSGALSLRRRGAIATTCAIALAAYRGIYTTRDHLRRPVVSLVMERFREREEKAAPRIDGPARGAADLRRFNTRYAGCGSRCKGEDDATS